MAAQAGRDGPGLLGGALRRSNRKSNIENVTGSDRRGVGAGEGLRPGPEGVKHGAFDDDAAIADEVLL